MENKVPMWPLKIAIGLFTLVAISHIMVAMHVERWGDYGPGKTFYGQYAYDHCEEMGASVDQRITNHWSCSR